MVTPAESRVPVAGSAGDRSLAQHPAVVGLIGLLLIGGYGVAWLWAGGTENLARLFPLSLLGGASAILWAVSRVQRGPGWPALAGGLTLWAGAACFQELVQSQLLPASPLISPLITTAANACWIIALLSIYGHQQVKLNFTRLLDAVLVLGCGITVAGNSVLGPLGRAGPTAIYPFVAAAAGLLLFAALVFLRYTIEEPLPAADALALAGVLVALFSQSWDLWNLEVGPFASEPVLGIFRIGAGLLFLAGAYEALVASAARRMALWEGVAHWLPVICLSVVSGLLVLHFSGYTLPGVIFGTAIISLSLAVLRLGFALGENHRLRQQHTQLRSQNEEYIRLAISDPLTGLFNKGYFAYHLHEEFARSERYVQPLTLIALDLDNFKQVNDRYGHAAGDTLLVAISSALRAASRLGDTPCRCGGDEFMLILPQTSVEQGAIVAERLRAAVNGALWQRGLSPLVSVSVGVAGYPSGAATANDLAHRADQALYFAKQNGKNRCVRWTPAIPHQLAPASIGSPQPIP